MISSLNSNYDYRIDIIRAIACILVAVIHVSVPTFTGPLWADAGFIGTIILSLVECGWIGVPIFLFISGYSLALGKYSPGHSLDILQFALNRLLRLYPIYVIVLVLLVMNHGAGATTILQLMLFQLQAMPPATAFNIAWSLQLEVGCYFLFPVVLYLVREKSSGVFALLGALLFLRLLMVFQPSERQFLISYSSLLGGGVIFTIGMMSARLPRLRPCAATRVATFAGIFGIVMFCLFVASHGGYQAPTGRVIKYVFLFMPEFIGLSMFLIAFGYLRTSVPGSRICPTAKAFAYFGTISYSAYIFSLFVHDFVAAYLGRHSGGWLDWAYFLFVYFVFLTATASLTYFGLEKPFLNLRKSYLRRKQ